MKKRHLLSDLSIGNLLQYFVNEEGIGWSPFRVDAEEILQLANNPRKYLSRNKPIPLSGQVLAQCGFENSHGSWWRILCFTEYDTDVSFYITVNLRSFRCGVYPNTKTQGVPIAFPVKIKYLHQLQNFYFTINGKELNTKKIYLYLKLDKDVGRKALKEQIKANRTRPR